MNLCYVFFFWLVVFIHLEAFAKSEQSQSPAENPENNQTSEGKPEPLPPRQFFVNHVNYGDHGEAQPLSKVFDGFTTFTNKKSNLSDLLTVKKPSWFWGRKIPR